MEQKQVKVKVVLVNGSKREFLWTGKEAVTDRDIVDQVLRWGVIEATDGYFRSRDITEIEIERGKK